MSIKNYFESNKIARKKLSGMPLSNEEMEILRDGIKTEQKVKSTIRLIWNFTIGLCSIIAAIFSILSYFK